jgi:hypothetical protein
MLRVERMLLWQKATLNTFLHFVCHHPGIAAPEGSVDGDCSDHVKLCAELNVRAAEESSEGANLLCCFLDPPGNFHFVAEFA